MKRYWLTVIACMVATAVLVWFVPGASKAVEDFSLTLLLTFIDA